MGRVLGLAVCVLIVPAFPQERARALFRTHCAPCHGAEGDGGRGSNLTVPRLPRAADDAALSSVITLGIPGTQMPGTRMTADENRELVAYVRALGRSTAAAAAPPSAGNAARGAAVYRGKGGCGRCHTVGMEGGRLGPDLSEIGLRRSASHLRTSLVEPEAEVPESFAVYRRLILMPDNFLLVRAVTAEGVTVNGVRLNEDTFTIQVRDFSDRVHSFEKASLKELRKQWGRSPMPGYRGVLTEEEITDVVAYLASLRGAQ